MLLVEDDDSVREMANKVLERGGYRVFVAGNAEDALRFAQTYAGPIEVLLADVSMPGMKGPELAKRLQPRRPEMKVLFVSGYQHDEVRRQGLSREADLLCKPFSTTLLLSRVERLLAQGARAQ